MSQAVSPSAGIRYGLVRVTRIWRLARSTVYARRGAKNESLAPEKRGPKRIRSDADLLVLIRQVLDNSEWVGEGYRKIWARLRFQEIRTSARRVLRLMREADLLAPTRAGNAHGSKAHEGTIIPERPDALWGTDQTSTLTGEGNATIFFVVDHCTTECLGIHAARPGTRFEALEPLHQAVAEVFGGYKEGVAASVALQLRHDHGSQFISDVFQHDLRFLGIDSSPAFVREPECNGCAERFVRTLKEQLLWLRRFETVEELRVALQEFRVRYNRGWIVGRHGYQTPAAVRAYFNTAHAEVAA
jgi:transposase InsO family protein